MFKITPVQDPALGAAYLDACGASAKEGCFLYAMTDCETLEIMGIAQFELTADYGYIFDLKEPSDRNDFEAMFILGRQTMNFINSCGLDACRASLCAADHDLIKAIGFKKCDEYFECSLVGMFDGSHCSGHNVSDN